VEGWIRNISLSRAALLAACCTGLFATATLAAEPTAIDTEQVMKPQVERRRITEPQIDAEDFEVGLFGGMMSVEDFGVNPVFGVRTAYHLSEDFFVEAAVGQTKTTKTSYERLSGSADLLTSDERLLRYYDLSVGYNLFIIGGIGATHFAGNDRFTVNVGSGYRFLATDWLAIHGDLRDFIFDMDLFGGNQITNNVEIDLGATIFF
jgi:outer membrane beta-barrel protein